MTSTWVVGPNNLLSFDSRNLGKIALDWFPAFLVETTNYGNIMGIFQ